MLVVTFRFWLWFQRFKRIFEILRQIGGKCEYFFTTGVGELDGVRVKHLSASSEVGQFLEPCIVTLSVNLISYQGIANVLEMHPNLVGPASMQVSLDERRSPVTLKQLVACVG